MNSRKKLSLKGHLWPVLLLFCAMLYTAEAFAGSETWSVNPGTGDWNTTTNWVSGTVPNGTAAVATFDTSSVTGVSLSANTEVNSIVFTADANAYTITASPAFTLTL